MRGRFVLNGVTKIRGSLGEISATHVSLATAMSRRIGLRRDGLGGERRDGLPRRIDCEEPLR